ncbi:unnamed protein product [Lymnaea stagnalis]|uniref:Uncharacterized protein n=1 Tax=Lymnaea stagnalis TaxID=6523 RepID=A0AAV2HKH3_LYMST
MPLSQNPKESGWFYHAPSKKQIGAPKVDYPAPSNIPGIGYDDPESLQKQEVREMVFKESDTNYIRLAKMGGRKDLLAFKAEDPRKKSAGPVGYPRNDWFYLEDNRREDQNKPEEEKQPWEFLLPEYMVHKSYKPSFENPSSRPTRSAAPYHTEANSVIQEGRLATDKTVKIPELRRPGYGVRNEKPAAAPQKLPPREKPAKPQESEALQGERRKNPQVAVATERDEPTSMSKLLSGEYEREWYSKRAEVQFHHDGGSHNDTSEIEQNYGAEKTQLSSGHHRRGRSDLQPNNTQRMRTHEDEEREPFKLSRFKNIPSKVDSHQRVEIMAGVK